MSNQSIIEHKANMYYLEFREDYLQICNECTYTKPTKDGKKSKASPYCKALILAILEHWTNDKRSKGDGLYVYMSIPQWIASMYGMFGRNVIIDSLDELIGEGLIAKLPHKMYGRDTFKYLLNDRELNRRIRLLPERKPTDIYPFTNQRDQFTNQRVASTNQLDTSLQVNADPFTSKRNIESNRDTNIDSTQMQESIASATSAHALSVTDTSHQGDGDEIPHPDTRNPPAEPVVPPETAQASAVCTGRVAAVPEREESAGHLRRTEISLAKGDTDATSTLPDPDPLPAAEAFRNHVHRVEDGRVPVQAEAPVTRAEQTPFPVTSPSDGAVGPAPPSSGPRASGRRGKPQQRTVTQAELPPAPKFVLTEQEQAFWGLWCQVWFNKDIPPDLNDTAYKHVVKLAPHIKTAEQLESLIKRAKKDLEDAQGLKRKTVFLGNLVTSYSGWKQEQKPPEQPKPPQEAPAQPLPVLRVLPPDRSKSSRLRSASQTVGRA